MSDNSIFARFVGNMGQAAYTPLENISRSYYQNDPEEAARIEAKSRARAAEFERQAKEGAVIAMAEQMLIARVRSGATVFDVEAIFQLADQFADFAFKRLTPKE